MKENGRTPDGGAMSRLVALEQLIKQRENEILNKPLPAEDDLSDEDGVLDEDGNEPGTDLDKSKTTADQPSDKRTDADFATDSSDDNGSVVSDESEDEEPNSSSNDKANELKLQGDEHVRACEWANAIKCYTEALRHSQLAAVYGNRSLCYMKIEEFDKAEKDCSCAIELDPNYKRIFRRRAAIRLRLRDYYGSAKDLQDLRILSASSAIDPNIQEEYKAILPLARYIAAHGNCPTDQKFKELEAAALKKLRDKEEAAAKSFMNRSLYAQAVESLSMAIMVSPNSHRFYYQRAMANFKLGKASLTENDCTAAIDLDSSYAQYFRLRAQARKKLGNLSGSEADEKMAKKLPSLWSEKSETRLEATEERLQTTEKRPVTTDKRLETTEKPPVTTDKRIEATEKPPVTTDKRLEKTEKRSEQSVRVDSESRATSQESRVFVRVPVQDVYSSSIDELYDLSKLPEKIKSLFGLS